MLFWLKGILVMQVTALLVQCDASKPVYHELSKQMFQPPTPLNKVALFGYSVTYLQTDKTLIISAPKANDIGEVFQCTIEDSHCMKVDVKPPKLKTHVFHDYWLGATVKAGVSFFMTCAPRALSSGKLENKQRTGTFAMCYYQDSAGSDHMFTAERISIDSKEKQFQAQYPGNSSKFEDSMDSFGWSIEVAEDNTVLVGSPAMTTGRVMIYPKGVRQHPVLLSVNTKYFKQINASVFHNFGYSITSGRFFRDNNIYYAISSPYGEIGVGKVLLFNNKYQNLSSVIVDEEVGSLFGASLCAANLGAEQTALLVGAPAFAPSLDGPSSNVDLGAVHVYHNENGIMQLKRTIMGSKDGSYFGHAIASVGDLNGDRIDEVVISAPYEDDGRGAVYIFCGAEVMKNAAEVPTITWLQKIKAESPNEYLGLSLSPLQDYDDNGCRELAIGIPGNNSVLLLRCMASVTVHLHAEFPNLEKSLNSTFFHFEQCLNVTFPEKPKIIRTNIRITIKLTHPNATLQYTDKHGAFGYEVSLEKLKDPCKRVQVWMPPGGDYDQKLEFNISANLSDDPMTRVKFDPNLVIFSNSSQPVLMKSIQGPGSQLLITVDTTLSDQYRVGSSENETMRIFVKNTGNIARHACVRVRVDDVNVERPPRNCTLTGGLLTCILPSLTNEDTTDIHITLDTKSLTSDSKNITIEVELFKICSAEEVWSRYTKTFVLTSDVNSIIVKGSSVPVVDVTKSELEFGIQGIKHVYTVTNKGITNWGLMKFDIDLPPEFSCSVNTDSSDLCTNNNNMTYTCAINNLQRNSKINIIIIMTLSPGSHLIKKIYGGATSVSTHLTTVIGSKSQSESITSTIKLVGTTSVPLWIIIVAAIVGFIILFIIAFILYECGFLRRKHRQELQALKKDIKRQSIRRSMRLRESIITVVTNQQENNDRQCLIGLKEDTEPMTQVELDSSGGQVAFKKSAPAEKVVTEAEIH